MSDPSIHVRVGIVGAGANTRAQHIPGLRAIEGVEIISVANRSRESSRKVARQFGIPQAYDSWQELVAAEDTNAIAIGTWPYLHCEVTEAALAAGKHVLCEARMAMDADEAHRMLRAAKTHPRLVTQLVPSPFTLRVDQTICDLVGNGYLGQVLAIKVRDNQPTFVDRNAPLHWRQDAERSGLNVLSLGIWYEALMRWLGEARKVMAMGKVFVSERYDSERAEKRTVLIPDHIDVLAEMACGAQANFELSSVTGLAGSPEVWIFGSEGTLRYEAAQDQLYGGRRGEEQLRVIEIPPEREGRWRVEEEFVNAIRGTEAVRLTTFENGVKYMEFTEAVARSIDSGRSVLCPP